MKGNGEENKVPEVGGEILGQLPKDVELERSVGALEAFIHKGERAFSFRLR